MTTVEHIEHLSQCADIPRHRRRQLVQIAAELRGEPNVPKPGRQGWPVMVTQRREIEVRQ